MRKLYKLKSNLFIDKYSLNNLENENDRKDKTIEKKKKTNESK